ncbi:MAG TPA: MBL fold metallo-hydrolase, partial [Burkholderiaceae bacterium]|nr:MBL fold metallo-hydrolase [Burkholderiaceae bacterium]
AHNEPFRGLHARLARLNERRVVDLFGTLFAREVSSDPQLLNLATGETVAHLNYLIGAGQAVRETDAQGVDWYRAA